MNKLLVTFVAGLLCVLTGNIAYAALSESELRKVVNGYRGMETSQKAQLRDFLRSERIDFSAIDVGVVKRGCELFLSIFGVETPKQTVTKRLKTVSREVEEVLRNTVIKQESVPTSWALAQLSHRSLLLSTSVGINELQFPSYLHPKRHGVVISLVIEKAKRAHGSLNKSSNQRIIVAVIEAEASNGTAINFDIALDVGTGEPLRLTAADVNLRGGTPEDFLKEIILAGISHYDILSDSDRFAREVNMLAYDLKKLIRVTPTATAKSIYSLIESLPKTATGHAVVSGTDFISYLNVKRELISLGQLRAHEDNAALAASASSSKKAKGYKPQFVKTGGDDHRIVGYSRKGIRSNGYYVNRRKTTAEENDDSSSTIATVAWMMDPAFMLTHPWYWGVSDSSFLAPVLMFQMMQSRSDFDAFSRAQNYNDGFFAQPLEPVYYQGRDLPVADAWNSPLRPDVIQPVVNSGEVGWQKVNGQDVIVDNQVLNAKWEAFVGENDKFWSATGDQLATAGVNSAVWQPSSEPVIEVQAVDNPEAFFDAQDDDDSSDVTTDKY